MAGLTERGAVWLGEGSWTIPDELLGCPVTAPQAWDIPGIDSILNEAGSKGCG